MIVGSTFTGVGGFDLGFERAGMRIAWQCEKDAKCRRVLANHWPDVPCYHDVRDIQLAGSSLQPVSNDDGTGRVRRGLQAGHDPRRPDQEHATEGATASIDLLCGGFPCQDLSVAGRRRGLAGERSGLFFEFARVADDVISDGGWIVIENVPGLFSSNGGRDFAIVLATLAELGFHDLAWRVLDSRYFNVPQRRRRVFIVARRSTGSSAQQVLLEPESGGGDFAPSGKARARVAATLSKGSSGTGVSAPGRRQEDDENIVVGSLTRRPHGTDENEILAGHTFVSDPETDPNGMREIAELSGRLDDPLNPAPDSHRYSMMGNAITVNVAEWIGRRLMAHDPQKQKEIQTNSAA